MRDAAIAGLGIALLPSFLLQIPLKKKTLNVQSSFGHPPYWDA
jgi:DNA-binding transcriptional LysR family regulator